MNSVADIAKFITPSRITIEPIIFFWWTLLQNCSIYLWTIFKTWFDFPLCLESWFIIKQMISSKHCNTNIWKTRGREITIHLINTPWFPFSKKWKCRRLKHTGRGLLLLYLYAFHTTLDIHYCVCCCCFFF